MDGDLMLQILGEHFQLTLVVSFLRSVLQEASKSLYIFTISKLESLLLEICTKETIGWLLKFLFVIIGKQKQLKSLIENI